MDIQEEIRNALAAIRGGMDPAYVDTLIQQRTGFNSLAALQRAVDSGAYERVVQNREEAAGFDEQRAALERLEGTSPVGNFARMLGQGASFGWLDEVMGDRQRVEDLRTIAPGTAAVTEMAGGMAVPGLPALAAVRGGGAVARGGGRAALRGLGIGAGTGAAGGGLFAAGEAESGERLAAAARGAGMGAMAGGLLAGASGTVGSLVNRAKASQGQRVAGYIRDLTEVTPDMIGSRRAVRNIQQRIQDGIYKPLERVYAEVQDPRVLDVVTRLRNAPGYRAVLRRAALDVEDAPVSFSQVQKLRTLLRKRAMSGQGDNAAMDLFEDLDDAMLEAFDGLQVADASWRATSRHLDALQEGWRMATRSTAELDEAVRRMSPGQRDSFRMGRLARIDTKLRERDQDSVAMLRRFIDAGPETQNMVRGLFPDDQSANRFFELLRSERKLDNVVNFWNATTRIASQALLAMAAGGAAGAMMGRGN